MTSEFTRQGQDVVKCDLCQEGVSFFCRRCEINICDPCLPLHLRQKTRYGHDVVNYNSKQEDESFNCDLHPRNTYSAYCKTCETPICSLCFAFEHKSHKISELPDEIELITYFIRGGKRLSSLKNELETILHHTVKQLSSLSSFYQKKKDEVTVRGEEWHKLIEKSVKNLHHQLDDLKKENKTALQKQRNEFEKLIGIVDEMNKKATKLQKSNNITEMQKYRTVIDEQLAEKKIAQNTFPTFYECKIDEHYLQTYFGYIEKLPEENMTFRLWLPDVSSSRKVLEVPKIVRHLETKFPVNEKYKCRLYDMALTADKEVWMGGSNGEFKLFDLKGNLHGHRTVPVKSEGLYICMHNKHILFSDVADKAVKTFSSNDTVVTMFTTGDWKPYGITSSASGDLLLCLRKDDQSKVVRYSSTGTILQEIQYGSNYQPLYQCAWYIDENVNEDIVVSDYKKNAVIAVNVLGIFRYQYSGKHRDFSVRSITTDSIGHVFVADLKGNKIHMLDRDGRFLRYIIPDGGIEHPRAVCIISVGEMIVGESMTGIAKTIRFQEDQKDAVSPAT
ncbi:uncharacterized protein LOC111126984 [Crassostrea virginica]